MNVLLVRVRTDDKGVLAFQKAGCKLIPDFICVLGCDLTRLEGLAHLIHDDIVLRVTPCDLRVFPFGQQKLRICRVRVAGIGGNQFTLIGLFRILAVVCSVCQHLCYRPPFADVHRNNASSCHSLLLPMNFETFF